MQPLHGRRLRIKPAPAGGSSPSAPSSLLDWRAPYLVPLAILFVTRLWILAKIPFAAEDAYICFRYASNWVSGLGPVFNPGEHVMGFTSPLWTAWVALAIRLGADPVAWTRGTLVAADAVTLVLMARLLEQHASRAAAWGFGFFFATWPYFSALTASGLEMGFALTLVVLASTLIGAGSPFAGPALGALALVRPEGLAAAAVLALWAGGRDRFIAAGITGAGLAALALVYGSPVPQSLVAKALVYGTPGPLAGPQWWDWVVPFPLKASLSTSEGGNLFLITVVMFPAAIAGARALWAVRRTALAGAVAAMLVVWFGYLSLGVTYFYWYLVIPLAGIAALASVGLPTMTRGRLLPLGLAMMIAGSWSFAPYLYLGRAFSESGTFAPVADVLTQYAKPGDKVLLEPIGTIGWRNPRLVMLDEVGLVSPRIAARRHSGPGWYADVVDRERPQWLVTRRALLRSGSPFGGTGQPFRNVDERSRVFAGYVRFAETDSSAGDQTILVLRRLAQADSTKR